LSYIVIRILYAEENPNYHILYLIYQLTDVYCIDFVKLIFS